VGIEAAARRLRLVAPPQRDVKASPPAFAPVSDHLQTIVWADVYGAENLPMSRAAAMQVPAMARARNVLCPAIGRTPLVALRGDEVIESPTWLQRTDGQLGPFHRMTWTVDDVLFTGWSCWAVERGADGFPLKADRIPRHLWSTDDLGRVEIDGTPVQEDSVILIPGPHEGVLTFGSRALSAAAALEQATTRAAFTPIPGIDLHQTTDVALSDTEIDALIARWVTARRGENGGVAFTSFGIDAKPVGQTADRLLLEGRNGAAVDIARLASVPAASIDATTEGASLTYETTAGRNAELIDYGLAAYATAISGRLSQDDVMPRGSRVAFDFTDMLATVPDPTGPTLED